MSDDGGWTPSDVADWNEYLRWVQRDRDNVDGSFGRETWWAITDAPWWRRAWDRVTDPVRALWWRVGGRR